MLFFTNRLSEANESLSTPQAEAWGFDTIAALRADQGRLMYYSLFTVQYSLLTKFRLQYPASILIP